MSHFTCDECGSRVLSTSAPTSASSSAALGARSDEGDAKITSQNSAATPTCVDQCERARKRKRETRVQLPAESDPDDIDRGSGDLKQVSTVPSVSSSKVRTEPRPSIIRHAPETVSQKEKSTATISKPPSHFSHSDAYSPPQHLNTSSRSSIKEKKMSTDIKPPSRQSETAGQSTSAYDHDQLTTTQPSGQPGTRPRNKPEPKSESTDHRSLIFGILREGDIKEIRQYSEARPDGTPSRVTDVHWVRMVRTPVDPSLLEVRQYVETLITPYNGGQMPDPISVIRRQAREDNM